MGSSYSKKKRLLRSQEKSLTFQMTNLRKAILDSDDSEALIWLSRILVISTADQSDLFRHVARLLVRIAAEDVDSQDEDAFKLAAAVWVSVRESAQTKKLSLSAQETLALATIYMARTPKSSLVRDALAEAYADVKADNRPCSSAARRRKSRKGLSKGQRARGRGGGVDGEPARGKLFSSRKLAHSIANVRMFLLRSDMENSLYWLAQTLRHIFRLSHHNTYRRRMMALQLASFLRGIAHDFVIGSITEEIVDAAFSIFDFASRNFDPCGDLIEMESVLALVIVKLARAPKTNFVMDTFQTVLDIRRKLETTSSSMDERGSVTSRSISLGGQMLSADRLTRGRQPSRRNQDGVNSEVHSSKSRDSRIRMNNGEDASLFEFSTVKNWLKRRRPRQEKASQLRKSLRDEDAPIPISRS